MLGVSSPTSNQDGDAHTIANSGELLREGIHRFTVFLAPLDELLLPHALRDELLLPSHSMGSGVVGIDGAVMNSGNVCRWS
jgi:hypothetical protein